MSELIMRDDALHIVDVAEDEHPYKVPGLFVTYSEYNQGWSDAVDFIRSRMENADAVLTAPRWVRCEEGCDLCRDDRLEKGDTLYQSSDWDGGIGFDYIIDIRFCPKCGRELTQWKRTENTIRLLTGSTALSGRTQSQLSRRRMTHERVLRNVPPQTTD